MRLLNNVDTDFVYESFPSSTNRGPKNPNHKTYLQNNSIIQSILCDCIANRRVDIKASELYHGAGISAPSFYLRYSSADDAMHGYERDLAHILQSLVPDDVDRPKFFFILTSFIIKYQQYFIATTKGGDIYWLAHVIAHYCHNLVGTALGQYASSYYIGAVTTIISCWIRYSSELNTLTATKCINHLLTINIPKLAEVGK